jgi:DNA-directed RNA polymerase subunit RPC12/RpoP
MKQKSLKDEIFQVKCVNCNKPFHITAHSKSDDPGEQEIALNCPYCKQSLMVKVPRRILGTEVMLRALESQKAKG